MEKSVSLGEYGPHLWTRELARDIRARLEAVLGEVEPGDTVVIDAAGVEVFDYSFANELFGKAILSLPHEHPGRFLIVTHLTAYTRENLIKALESLNLIMIERKGRKLELLGKVHPADRETFAALAQAKGPLTALEIKDRLGINLTAVNERLAKLTRLALARRERTVSSAGREQFQYRVLS